MAWRRSGGNCFSRCVLWNWMTWGVREGELSCSAGEGEFFRFNLLCSFRFHRDFISFHKAVHSLTITVVIFFNSHSSNSLLFDDEMFFSQSASWDLCCLSATRYPATTVNIHVLLSLLTAATTWTLGVPTDYDKRAAPWATYWHSARSNAFWFVSVLSNCSVSSHCARQVRLMYWLPRTPATCPVHLHYTNDKTGVDFRPQTGVVPALLFEVTTE